MRRRSASPSVRYPLFSQMADFTAHEAAQVAALSAAEALFQAEEPEPATTVSRRRLLGG